MRKYFDVVFLTTSIPAAGAYVYVLDSSGNRVSLYSDNGVTSIPNPVTTDRTGFFSFYVADGTYTLQYTLGGVTLRTLTAVQIYDESSASGVSNAIANGTATDAGTLNGAETVPVSRGSGLLQTTLTKIAQWVIGTFQGFTQSGTGAVARTPLAKLLDLPITPQDWGADPTGVIDSTAAIQAAINAATAQGRQCVGVGTFRTSGTIVFTGNADFSNAIVNVYGTPAVAVEISTGNASNPTTILQDCVVLLPKNINNMTKPGTGWAGQGVGVRTVNLYSCNVYVGDVQGFATGLLVTAFSGNGNGYNSYFIGRLNNNGINLDVAPGDAGSWTNENAFYAGRYSHNSNEGSAVVGTRHIRLLKSANYVNNNVFTKPSVEGDVAEYHIENGGSYNTFVNARFDSNRPNVLYTYDNSSQGSSNTFIGGYLIDNVVYTYTGTGGGGRNKTYGYFNDYVSISSSTGHRFRNIASSNNPIQSFYEAGVVPENATASQWCVQHGPYYLYGKRSTDSYSRLKVDYQNGRIYFDNGTTVEASKTAYIGPQGANAMGCFGMWYPGATATYDFGSNTLRWRTAYLGNVSVAPAASVTPTNNGEVMLQLTSDTQLTFKVKGSDGTVRSASLTLA